MTMSRISHVSSLLLTVTAIGWSGAAQAAILEDVPFNDAAGTAIQDAVNVATGHQFDVDADLVDVKTNGLGQLDASLKANNDFGTTYIDIDPVLDEVFTSGRFWGVMELTWDFDELSLDTAENEEIRLSLIQFSPRSTFVTAEMEIQREDDNTLTILGNGVGTGATDISPIGINMTQTQTFIAIIAVDLDADVMELYFSDDAGASFSIHTGGTLDPARGIGSLRLTLNNDLSQDSVLIDRIYLTDQNPYPSQIPNVPEPSSALLLGLGGLALCRKPRS